MRGTPEGVRARGRPEPRLRPGRAEPSCADPPLHRSARLHCEPLLLMSGSEFDEQPIENPPEGPLCVSVAAPSGVASYRLESQGMAAACAQARAAP